MIVESDLRLGRDFLRVPLRLFSPKGNPDNIVRHLSFFEADAYSMGEGRLLFETYGMSDELHLARSSESQVCVPWPSQRRG